MIAPQPFLSDDCRGVYAPTGVCAGRQTFQDRFLSALIRLAPPELRAEAAELASEEFEEGQRL